MKCMPNNSSALGIREFYHIVGINFSSASVVLKKVELPSKLVPSSLSGNFAVL